MSDRTGISWTDATWNPTRGCSRVSPGCQHCYAEVQAARIVRMGKGKPTTYDGLVRTVGGEPRWTGVVRLVPEQLAWPLRKKKPLRIFVNSMSDLFHEKLSNEQIAAVFGVMAACPQHTFQVLTKRARRMREWFEWIAAQRTPLITIAHSPRLISRCRAEEVFDDAGIVQRLGTESQPRSWPLPNVWLGVSVENQEAADERIPELLETPATVRFLSCEPLLGPIDLSAWTDPCAVPCGEERWPDLDWLIAGCESGRGARPCNVEWLRSLRDQCADTGLAFFAKQATEQLSHATSCAVHPVAFGAGSKRKPGGVIELPYLDGVQHAEFPR